MAGGYLDRVALVMAVVLVGVGRMSIWIPVAYLMAPGLTLLAAVQRSKERPILPYLASALVMFPADLLMSVRSVAGLVRATPTSWGRGA